MGATLSLFPGIGDMRYPSTILISDLLDLISQWISAGDHVILAMDANQDVYSGKLATALSQEPLNMTCLMHRATGERVPNSHLWGTGRISTIFGSPGVRVGHGMCYPHWFGIGDHRVMVLEISAHTAFGGAYPAISPHTSRTLSCRTKRLKDIYCNKLLELTTRHKMHERLLRLHSMDGDSYSLAHNKWDSELGEYMRCAEKECSHYKDGTIDYSPTVGQWLRRQSVLKWLLRWHEGRVPDTRNLLRAAHRLNIDNPLQL